MDFNSYIKTDYLIIGFGVSGIAAGIELRKRNKQFVICEQTDKWGGCWNYALSTSRLQTHRKYYKFNDVEYDSLCSEFPTKKEVLSYLKKSIDHFNLLNNAIFNFKPDIVKCNGYYKWKAYSKNNKIEILAKTIICCCGTTTIPYIPEQFKHNINNINVIHSKYFNYISKGLIKQNHAKQRLKIALIGNGASCCDILNSMEKTYNNNFEAFVFYRTPKFYLEKYVLGAPCHLFLTKPLLNIFEEIPLWLNNFLLALANVFFIKNYLELPNSKINSKNIIASKIIQTLISNSQLTLHKEIPIEIIQNSIDKLIIKTNEAIYNDIDVCVFCTGYSSNEMFFKYDFLYEYLIPIVEIKDSINNEIHYYIIDNIIILGQNRTYNFLANCQSRISLFLNNKIDLSNEAIEKWIFKTKHRKEKNNLDFLDSTYELYEL